MTCETSSGAPDPPKGTRVEAEAVNGPVPEPIDARTFQACAESSVESQRLWALESAKEMLFKDNAELVGKVLSLLCDPSWAVKRQALALLQRLGGLMDAACVEFLHRLLYHPDNVVQLLVARVLEHVPNATAWKKVLDDRQVALSAVMQHGLALEFVLDSFRQDKEVVLAAVAQNGDALKFAESWCHDEEVVLAAVMQSGTAVHFADAALIETNPGLQELKAGRGLGLCGSYLVLEEVGQGVYGSVAKAKHLQSGNVVAIKKSHFEADFFGEGIPAHTLREVSLLKNFRHRNIVRLLDVLDVGLPDLRLVFEFLPRNLFDTLKALKVSGSLLPMQTLRRYTADLLEGLFACHSRTLVHRDLKPQNILLTAEGTLKLADFGLSRLIATPNRRYTLEVITLWYRSPEMLLGTERYGYEVDCWSAGCVMAEMATSRALFPGDCEIDTLFKIFRALGTPSENHWPEGTNLRHWKDRFPKWNGTGLSIARPELMEEEHGDGRDLLRQLLCVDPSRRLSSRRAREHAFCAAVMDE